eukprot:1459088-Lingulodinium_polyedra.AAC.1
MPATVNESREMHRKGSDTSSTARPRLVACNAGRQKREIIKQAQGIAPKNKLPRQINLKHFRARKAQNI